MDIVRYRDELGMSSGLYSRNYDNLMMFYISKTSFRQD